MTQEVINHLMAFACTFVAVFLKGFQHKNVIANMYGKTFITSYFMAFIDVLAIGVIAKSTSWYIAFSSGTGAALGMMLAMYLHNRLFSKKAQDELSGNQR